MECLPRLLLIKCKWNTTHCDCDQKISSFDVAKTFDALGWYSPKIVKAEILLQMLWVEKINWDDVVSAPILNEWTKWRNELPILPTHKIPRCYFPKESIIVSTQLHGYSDTSERAYYTGVVYLWSEDSNGAIHTSLVMSKTRVVPIKWITIPCMIGVKQSIDHSPIIVTLQKNLATTSQLSLCLDWSDTFLDSR